MRGWLLDTNVVSELRKPRPNSAVAESMAVEGQKRRHTFGQPDLFIAAIAALEDLVVVTRDTGDFVTAGVPVFDPWSNILHVHGKEVRIEPPASVHTLAELILKRG